MLKKKRIEYIDIAKGIGIIFVISGHLLNKNSAPYAFIYSFHMPLFFVLSGLLMTDNTCGDFKHIIESQCKLLREYLAYSGLYCIFDYLVRIILLNEMDTHQLIWNVYKTITLFGINVLWFIPSLCIAKILAQFLLKKFSFFKSEIIALLLFFAVSIIGKCFTMEIASRSVVWLLLYFPIVAFVRPIGMICFLYFGYILKARINRFTCKCMIAKVTTVVMLLLITLLCVSRNGAVDTHYIDFANPLLTMLTGISGSLMIIFLSQILEETKTIKCVLRAFGKNSLLIMVIHQYLLKERGCKLILESIGLCSIYLEIALTCVVSLFVAEIINRMKEIIRR